MTDIKKITVPVNKLKPNHARDLKRYPLRQNKLDYFLKDFEAVGYWGNILVRRALGGWQLIYGHHRLGALKLMGRKRIQVDCISGVDDAMAVRMMVTENNYTEMDTMDVLDSIAQAKAFIEREVGPLSGTGQRLFKRKDDFLRAQEAVKAGQGVGWKVIQRFLGGHFSKWIITEALSLLRSCTAAEAGQQTFEYRHKTQIAVPKEALVAFKALGTSNHFKQRLLVTSLQAKHEGRAQAYATLTAPDVQIDIAKKSAGSFVKAKAMIEDIYHADKPPKKKINEYERLARMTKETKSKMRATTDSINALADNYENMIMHQTTVAQLTTSMERLLAAMRRLGPFLDIKPGPVFDLLPGGRNVNTN